MPTVPPSNPTEPFRESVLKSAQEYRQQHRMEVDTSESAETEETTFHEIQNPNDELAVTYLFYELQRTYRISEQIHELTPVILVANDVPAPHEIDDAWLIEHDWILRRAILDDSFRPALDYLTKSFVGAEVNIRILEANAIAQKELVDRINQQIQVQMGVLATNEQQTSRTRSRASAEQRAAAGDLQHGEADLRPDRHHRRRPTPGPSTPRRRWSTTRRRRWTGPSASGRGCCRSWRSPTTALQAAVDKLSAAVKEHYDRVAEIDRLRVHVKENILYYMQAIWRQEPPDQRFFRLYDIDVPIVTPDDARRHRSTSPSERRSTALRTRSRRTTPSTVSLPMPDVDGDEEEARRGRRPGQRARLQGQLHGLRRSRRTTTSRCT